MSSTPRQPSRAFRVAAAALAAAPVGFAAGALYAGRSAPTGADEALTILSLGLAGAMVAALLLGLAALSLPPKPTRVVTLAFAGVSFALLAYIVLDFVGDRIARAQALEAAYAELPHFELALAAKDIDRRAFSQLALNSQTREYVAHRPGGWRCEGTASRAQTVALFDAMQAADLAPRPSCGLTASWRNIGGVGGKQPNERGAQGCIAFGSALFAVADNMVEATERKASCRRASLPVEP